MILKYIYDPLDKTRKKILLKSKEGLKILNKILNSFLKNQSISNKSKNKKTTKTKKQKKNTKLKKKSKKIIKTKSKKNIKLKNKKAVKTKNKNKLKQKGGNIASKNIFVIGDVHGNLTDFKDILIQTGLMDRNEEWRGSENDILVQVGDIVDRGSKDLDCLRLLKKLQEQAKSKNRGKVVRLVGNHELLVLSGEYGYSNKNNGEKSISDIKQLLLEGIENETIHGCFSCDGMIFLHAGVTNTYLISNNIPCDCEAIENYINKELLKIMNGKNCFNCIENIENIENQCFDEGACNIGNNQSQLLNSDGPFWVRTRCDSEICYDDLPSEILQIVGHTNNVDEGIKNQGNKIIYTDMGLYHDMHSNGFIKIICSNKKKKIIRHQWNQDQNEYIEEIIYEN